MKLRPILDTWLLARPKVDYYGAYPSGFLERARTLLGVAPDDAVLHVCAGKVRDYPFRGFGRNDRTLDLDAALEPDFELDVRHMGGRVGDRLPCVIAGVRHVTDPLDRPLKPDESLLWEAVLADPPYSSWDARRYAAGESSFVKRHEVLRRCLEIVKPGRRVGFLDFAAPRPPKWARLVALITVLVGYENQARVYSVYERETEREPLERARAMAAIRSRKSPSMQRGART